MIASLRTARPDPELLGGKGANLARLSSAGFPVPSGFVVTTDAYRSFVETHELDDWLGELSLAESSEAIESAVKQRFADTRIPETIAQFIRDAYGEMDSPAVAVRSSANAEDLPELSFAGQYESFLNVSSEEDVLDRVMTCWASLWTARAIAYRRTHGLSNASVYMAVVIQKMVPSEVAGVLFTANPVNGKRTEMVVEAAAGLGDALVSGSVEPARYLLEGKTGAVLLRQGAADVALSDASIENLARLGRRVAELFDIPQDIEWAFAEGHIHLVQSRPITSLYPLPEGLSPDGALHVFFSFGAVQGMLDPITPLGRDTLYSVFAGGAEFFGLGVNRDSQRALFTAGERIFVNATPILRSALGRRVFRRAFSMLEPSVAAAAAKLPSSSRLTEGFRPPRFNTTVRLLRVLVPLFVRVLLAVTRPDQRRRLIARRVEAILDDYDSRFRATRTLAVRLALADEAFRMSFPTIVQNYLPLVATGMASLALLHRLSGPDTLKLTRGLPHNVTTEMDLELWDTAVAIQKDGSLQHLESFLKKFGMRGVGEIDLGRPRWRKDPSSLERAIASYLRVDDPDRSPRTVFERGAREAEAAIEKMSTGWKGPLVRFLAKRMRALAGLRESPKFFVIRLMGYVREALLDSGNELVEASRLDAPEDVFFLRFSELSSDADWHDTVRTRRRANEREQHRRQIPRVLTSEGEAFYESGPAVSDEDNVLLGAPVSPGVAEGRVHVVLRPEGATLEPGDILVCPGTDPAWTPLFLVAGALVTEVGGMMTHGSVVAREYGIPAVVGVHEATTKLESGQRVRVDGTTGRVVLLD